MSFGQSWLDFGFIYAAVILEKFKKIKFDLFIF